MKKKALGLLLIFASVALYVFTLRAGLPIHQALALVMVSGYAGFVGLLRTLL